MKPSSIVIAGSGGHAKVIIEIIEQNSPYKIIGIITNDPIMTFEGYDVLGNDDVLPELIKKGLKNIALGVGGFKNNELRSHLFDKFQSLGLHIPTIIHPNAYVSSKAALGKGVVVCAGCSIITNATIQDNVILYTNSSVDHESIIHKNVLVSAGVTIGAYTIIGEGSLIALGAKVVSGVNVGKNVLVAAGAVVTKDIIDNVSVFGLPAKIK